MRVVNLTKHSVVVYDGDTVIAQWPPSGSFARIAEVADPAGELSVDGTPVPTVSCRYVDVVEDLPGAQEGVVYVVSRVLASVVPRGDIYFPYDEVRDHTGAIIGCRSLAQFASS